MNAIASKAANIYYYIEHLNNYFVSNKTLPPQKKGTLKELTGQQPRTWPIKWLCLQMSALLNSLVSHHPPHNYGLQIRLLIIIINSEERLKEISNKQKKKTKKTLCLRAETKLCHRENSQVLNPASWKWWANTRQTQDAFVVCTPRDPNTCWYHIDKVGGVEKKWTGLTQF